LSTLSTALVERILFKTEMSPKAPLETRIHEDIRQIAAHFSIPEEEAAYFTALSCVSTNMYSPTDDSIDILYNDGSTCPITSASVMLNMDVLSKQVQKHAYCYIRLNRYKHA
jgi:hypothetical protein